MRKIVSRIVGVAISISGAYAIDAAALNYCQQEVAQNNDHRSFVSRADIDVIVDWFNRAQNATTNELEHLLETSTIMSVQREIIAYENYVYPIPQCKEGAKRLKQAFNEVRHRLQDQNRLVSAHNVSLREPNPQIARARTIGFADIYRGECIGNDMHRTQTLGVDHQVELIDRACTYNGIRYQRVRFQHNGEWHVGWVRSDVLTIE